MVLTIHHARLRTRERNTGEGQQYYEAFTLYIIRMLLAGRGRGVPHSLSRSLGGYVSRSWEEVEYTGNDEYGPRSGGPMILVILMVGRSEI